VPNVSAPVDSAREHTGPECNRGVAACPILVLHRIAANPIGSRSLTRIAPGPAHQREVAKDNQLLVDDEWKEAREEGQVQCEELFWGGRSDLAKRSLSKDFCNRFPDGQASLVISVHGQGGNRA